MNQLLRACVVTAGFGLASIAAAQQPAQPGALPPPAEPVEKKFAETVVIRCQGFAHQRSTGWRKFQYQGQWAAQRTWRP